ncbi:hypothetical protein JCM6882_005977 [Rhodosporidiobolus microsporus]
MASSIIQAIVGKGYEHKDVPLLRGKRYFVTGGTNGIGLSIARTLYSHGADVLILGSQDETASDALAYIRAGDLASAPHDYAAGFGSMEDQSGEGGTESGEVEAKVVDFKDLKAVSKVAKELADKYERVDGFLGIAGLGVNKFILTDDGYDAHLTINNLAHMVFLSHLLPLLENTTKKQDADVRIVLMSSELHRTTFGGPDENYGGNKFRDLGEFKKDVGQQNLYARTKLAVILQSKALLQRYINSSKILTGQYEEAYGETVGKAIQTVVRPFMKTPSDGALSALWAATAPDARDPKYPNGSYFTSPQQPGGETSEADDQELVDNFWNNGLKVIEDVAGKDALGPFKA